VSCSDSDKTTVLRKGKRGQPGSQLGGSCASVAMIWQFNVRPHCNEDRAVLIRGPTVASRRFFQPCSKMSGFQAVPKSSQARNPSDVKVSSPITSIDNSIAIDPIEYIRMPSSFYYFEPDGDIVNNDWMPGKPSSPFGPVLGFYFHFIHPFIVVCDAASRPDYELDFSRSELLMSCREFALSTAIVVRVHINPLSFGGRPSRRRHTFCARQRSAS
jgi:hypothetical protein